MAETLSPHVVLAKLEEKEKLRLTNRLSAIIAEREKRQEALDETSSRLNSLERRREQVFSSGVRAADLIALNIAQQEQMAMKEVLSEQLMALRDAEKEVIRQLLVCENKAKVYARAQQKEEQQQTRRTNRSEQQKLDDVVAHRRMRRS